MDFNVYEKQRGILRGLLEQLRSAADRAGYLARRDKIDFQLARLSEERFSVAVVGQFSRGKSTFVNALLGRRILPSSKSPTTAIISKIVYRDAPHYVLHYRDERAPQEVPEQEFFALTAPKSVDESDAAQVEARNLRQAELNDISFAEVQYPLALCRDGVDLVDTPGMNDVDTVRVEVTYGFLNHADAVILVLAADQTLSQSERTFLEERILDEQIRDIFYVINRKDALAGPEEERRVLEFADAHIREIVAGSTREKPRIFLVSSYQALMYRRNEGGEALSAKQMMKIPTDFRETGFPELEERLGHFLTHEKGESKLRAQADKGLRHADALMEEIGRETQLLAHSLDEIIAQERQMRPAFERARAEARQTAQALTVNLERHTGSITAECDGAQAAILRAAREAVDSYQGEFNKQTGQQRINAAIDRSQKAFIERVVRMQQRLVEEESAKAKGRLQEIWSQVDMQYHASLLPVPTGAQPVSVELSIDEADLTISEERQIGGLAAGIVGIGALIAGAAALPAIGLAAAAGLLLGLFESDEEKRARQDAQNREKAKKHINSEIPKMTKNMKEKVLAAYAQQAQALSAVVERTIEERVSSMEGQLKQVIEEKRRQEKEQQERLALLRNTQGQVTAVRETLLRMAG